MIIKILKTLGLRISIAITFFAEKAKPWKDGDTATGLGSLKATVSSGPDQPYGREIGEAYMASMSI